MKLEEAIEILTNERKDHHSLSTDVIGQAEQLGIEALQFLVRWRGKAEIQPFPILPSETTD